jgi:hypothetical protein
MGVVEAKTVKKYNLKPTVTTCMWFKVIFFKSFTFYDSHLIGINTTPVAVNTVSCTPVAGCKRNRNMLSKIAVKENIHCSLLHLVGYFNIDL